MTDSSFEEDTISETGNAYNTNASEQVGGGKCYANGTLLDAFNIDTNTTAVLTIKQKWDTSKASDITKVLSKFKSAWGSVMAEFADVDVFFISADALLVELTAHAYLNWDLGGQTLVIAYQVDRFLEQLNALGGKFRLIWFSYMVPFYRRHTVLNFMRSFMLVHLSQSRWGCDVEIFENPLDPNWLTFVSEMTPSFLMTDIGCPSQGVSSVDDEEFSTLLASISLQLAPTMVEFEGWTEMLHKIWYEKPEQINRTVDISKVESTGDLWAMVIKQCKESDQLSEKFDTVAAAILIASLVIEKRGYDRIYLHRDANIRRGQQRGIDDIQNRRMLLRTCANLLDSIDFQNHPLKFTIIDLWDGRLVASILNEIKERRKVSPYRIQNELATLYERSCLKFPLEVDIDERLFDAVPESSSLLTDEILFPVDSMILNRYSPEIVEKLKHFCGSDKKESNVFENFSRLTSWPFYDFVPCTTKLGAADILKTEKLIQNENRGRQKLHFWFEKFAQSLEVGGQRLAVDFSRKMRSTAEMPSTDNPTMNKPTLSQKGMKGKKANISKKDKILETNRLKQCEKQYESEKQKILFSLEQGKDAVFFLENLLSKLELDKTLAMCNYEMLVRIYREFTALEGAGNLEKRRHKAVPVVRRLKDLYVTYWSHLTDAQKKSVNDIWNSLGFSSSERSTNFSKDRLSIDMDLIYFQLAYGGELIDIQSDPKKDERVTGFFPDAWQRRMLDVVDGGDSAIVVAPTSAGKTFISYYCAEKILRQSDEDIVVFISPSRALVNQVAASVLARYRGKRIPEGRTLYGLLDQKFEIIATRCQVIITNVVVFESMLLSTESAVISVCEKIKYIVFDEVHCLSASPEASIWEHVLLLCKSPFVALSATIANASVFHAWLSHITAQKADALGFKKKPKIELIVYEERYSELELYIQRMHSEELSATNRETSSVIEQIIPHSVYEPIKLRIFGIPDDQQLTSRQILSLYMAMAEVDKYVKEAYEPSKFFKYKMDEDKVWLTRSELRRLEKCLKEHYEKWLEDGSENIGMVVERLQSRVKNELEHRKKPFDEGAAALTMIIPLVLELRDKEEIPLICFNDNRDVCVQLASSLYDYFERQQIEFEDSREYKSLYRVKDEEKILKLSERMHSQLDTKQKKKPKKKSGDQNFDQEQGSQQDNRQAQQITFDEQLSMVLKKKMRLGAALEQFKVRGRFRDGEIYDFYCKRLESVDSHYSKILLKLFERGIGFHHQGMNPRERGVVEALFRGGHIGALFSTSTLALGINMPCKTVVFGVDTQQLTPLQYRQMSGRAGRRGYDRSGRVIFMAIPTRKIQRLLSASLSSLRGNLPFKASYLCRLFYFVYQKNKDSIGVDKSALSNLEKRMQSILTLMENPFILYTLPAKADAHRKQFKSFANMIVQILRWLHLLDSKGKPCGLAPLFMHMSFHEPGNLVFIHMLQKGVFHRICMDEDMSRAQIYEKLVLIFSHLFTHIPLPHGWHPDELDGITNNQGNTYDVYLKPLPQMCQQSIEEYNVYVDQLYKGFIQLCSDNNSLMGNIFSLTGKSDKEVDASTSNIVAPFHDKLSSDHMFLPTFPIDRKNHRGNKIYSNAYALDFWRNESRSGLVLFNMIDQSQMWQLFDDFTVGLRTITEVLIAISHSKDPFVIIMKELAIKYRNLMVDKFHMKSRP